MKLLNYILLLSLALWLGACDEDDEIVLTPAVSFKEATAIVAEDTGVVQIPMILTTALTNPAYVHIQIKENSITDGIKDKFCSYPSYIYLEAGAVRGNIPVNIIDNALPNDNISFELEIIKVEGGVTADLANQSCKITIADDDSKQTVSIGFDTLNIAVNENDEILEVPVIVKGILSDSLTFSVESQDVTTGNDDYELLTNKITILEGETWGVIRLAIKDKQATQEDRTLKLIIADVEDYVEGEETAGITFGRGECDVIIKKLTREVMFADSVLTIDEDVETVVGLNIALTAPVAQDVEITIRPKTGSTAVEGVHYTMESNKVIIKQGETLNSLPIVIINDTLGNADRFCDFEIESISPNLNQVDGMNLSRLLIKNEDTSVGFTITKKQGFERGKKLLIPIRLSGLLDKRVEVNVSVRITDPELEENTHFSITDKQITFFPGDSILHLEAFIMHSEKSKIKFDLCIDKVEAEGIASKIYSVDGSQKCNVDIRGIVKLDRSKHVTVDSTNTEATGSGGAYVGTVAATLDGNVATGWHAAWKVSAGDIDVRPAGDPTCVMIYAFDKPFTIVKSQMIGRVANAHTLDGGTMDVSMDKITWTRIVDFNELPIDYTSNQKASGDLLATEFLEAKYLRFIPKTKDTFPSFAEIDFWTFEE